MILCDRLLTFYPTCSEAKETPFIEEEEKKGEESASKTEDSSRRESTSLIEEMRVFEEAVVCIQRAWRGHEAKRRFDGIVDSLLEEEVEIPKRKKIFLDYSDDEQE